jgi:hypothetical protein
MNCRRPIGDDGFTRFVGLRADLGHSPGPDGRFIRDSLSAMDRLIIDARFNGPPGSGNGGYCAGRFAHAAGWSATGWPATETPATGSPVTGDAAEVTLRRPPPLQVEVATRPADEGVDVYHGADLVAQVRPARIGPDEIVEPVGWDEAVAASTRYPGLTTHPFPTCFACGPARDPGDGLRLFPGRLPDGRTAAPWSVPTPTAPELVWAALDCPGGWAIPLEGRPYVLGRLAVRIVRVPGAGERCVVMGAVTGEEGRKAYVRSSLWTADGDLLAQARATWLAVA